MGTSFVGGRQAQGDDDLGLDRVQLLEKVTDKSLDSLVIAGPTAYLTRNPGDEAAADCQ